MAKKTKKVKARPTAAIRDDIKRVMSKVSRGKPLTGHERRILSASKR